MAAMVLFSGAASASPFDSLHPAFAAAQKFRAVANDERLFLMRLGFEDYALMAQATAKEIKAGQRPGANPIAIPILDFNYQRLSALSAARELAVLARLGLEKTAGPGGDKGRETVALAQLTTLTTYHLLPFALIGLEPVPASVFQRKTGPAAAQLRADYLLAHSQKRYLAEKKSVVTVIANLLYSAKELTSGSSSVKDGLRKLDVLVGEVLGNEYDDTTLQQNRYLGRALVATLLRYSRTHGHPEVEARLRQELQSRGQYLDNHITSTLTFRDRKGRPQSVTVSSGDIANEYSSGSEAYQITMGVLPAPENRDRARDLKLVASLGQFASGLTEKMLNRAYEKTRSNEPLNEDEERLLREIWDPQLARGFSHAGMAEVRTDATSGISMVWIWDIYPNGNLGGVRYQTPENFAYAERYNRIGFVHYSAQKALSVFKKQMAEHGYRHYVWRSNDVVMTKDEDGDPLLVANSKKKVFQRAYIDAQTVQAWAQLPDTAAEAWYTREVVPRALRMLRLYMTGEEAMVFAAGFKNMDHSAYCSQLVVQAFLQGANFDPQAFPDQWRGVSKLASKWTDELPIDERVIAPGGFAWQKDLTDSVKIVDLDRAGALLQQTNAPFLNGRRTVIDENLQILQPILRSNDAALVADGVLTPLDPDATDVLDDDL